MMNIELTKEQIEKINKECLDGQETQKIFNHIKKDPEITKEFIDFWYGKLPPNFDIVEILIDKKCNGSYMDMIIRKKKLESILNK